MPFSSIRTILHPTDFSDAAMTAFAHALKLALIFRAELEVFHVEPDNTQTDWRWGPDLRDTLERWGILPRGGTEVDLAACGVRVRHATASGISADQAILEEMASSRPDLVVMATHGRSGIQRWLQPSITTPVATRGAVPVLIVPPNERSFVNPRSGRHALDRVLLPIDHAPSPQLAFQAARLFLDRLGADYTEVATVHVGGEIAEARELRLPDREVRHFAPPGGDPVGEIASLARVWGADLVVVGTEGRHGVFDAVLGSTAERLIGVVPAPMLVVPVRHQLAAAA